MSLSIFGYRVSDNGVDITLLGFLVRRVHFSNIEDIFLGSRGWAGEIWTVFKIRGLVTLKKKKGLLKYVTIAPKNPQGFVSKIKEKMQQK